MALAQSELCRNGMKPAAAILAACNGAMPSDLAGARGRGRGGGPTPLKASSRNEDAAMNDDDDKLNGDSNPNRGQWRKGQSGNPSGRPKRDADLQRAARSYTPEALMILARIMRAEKTQDAVRVAAARELLDRGWGKAAQTVHSSVTRVPVDPDDLTDEQLAAIAAGGELEDDDAPAEREAVAQRHRSGRTTGLDPWC
jgi:hypothetical protein